MNTIKMMIRSSTATIRRSRLYNCSTSSSFYSSSSCSQMDGYRSILLLLVQLKQSDSCCQYQRRQRRYSSLESRNTHHQQHQQDNYQRHLSTKQQRYFVTKTNNNSDDDNNNFNNATNNTIHSTNHNYTEDITGHYNNDQYIGIEDDDDPHVLAPLIVCGPPGIGTRSIIQQFLKQNPYANSYFVPIISHTNRLPKRDEENGIDYHFISDEEMEQMIFWEDFIEHSTINSKIYGTSYRSLLSVHGNGGPHRREIMDIDMYGVKRMKEISTSLAVESTGYKLRPKYIFIAPPDLPTLRYRLQQRNTDTESDIHTLLQIAEQEIHYGMSKAFHVRVYHITLDQVVQDFTNAVASLYESFDTIMKQQNDPLIDDYLQVSSQLSNMMNYNKKIKNDDDDDDDNVIVTNDKKNQFRNNNNHHRQRQYRNQLIQSLDQDAIQPILPQDSRIIRQARRKAYIESQKQEKQQQQQQQQSVSVQQQHFNTVPTPPPTIIKDNKLLDTSPQQSRPSSTTSSTTSTLDRVNFKVFR